MSISLRCFPLTNEQWRNRYPLRHTHKIRVSKYVAMLQCTLKLRQYWLVNSFLVSGKLLSKFIAYIKRCLDDVCVDLLWRFFYKQCHNINTLAKTVANLHAHAKLWSNLKRKSWIYNDSKLFNWCNVFVMRLASQMICWVIWWKKFCS